MPQLKGGDSLLYHAIKLYKLTPELHWYAGACLPSHRVNNFFKHNIIGGYIWPMDRTVEVGSESADALNAGPLTVGGSRMVAPPIRGTFNAYGEPEEGIGSLRARVEESGAVPLAETEITILSDWQAAVPVSKERVPFVSNGQLEKLVVNVLLVTYVP
jgi:hypothetical protein